MTVIVTYCCQENNAAQQIDAEHSISLNLWVRNFCLRKNIGFFHFPPVNKESLVNVNRVTYGECTSYMRLGFNYLNIHFTDDNDVPHVIILYYDPDWMDLLIDKNQGALIYSIVFKKVNS